MPPSGELSAMPVHFFIYLIPLQPVAMGQTYVTLCPQGPAWYRHSGESPQAVI
jgi:hypothetical protein